MCRVESNSRDCVCCNLCCSKQQIIVQPLLDSVSILFCSHCPFAMPSCCLASVLHPAATAKPNAAGTHPRLCSGPDQSIALWIVCTFNCAHFISTALLGELNPMKVLHTARCNFMLPLKNFKSKEGRQSELATGHKPRVFPKPNPYLEMPFIPCVGPKYLGLCS